MVTPSDTGGTFASIIYSLRLPIVRHLIVCGHTQCGLGPPSRLTSTGRTGWCRSHGDCAILGNLPRSWQDGRDILASVVRLAGRRLKGGLPFKTTDSSSRLYQTVSRIGNPYWIGKVRSVDGSGNLSIATLQPYRTHTKMVKFSGSGTRSGVRQIGQRNIKQHENEITSVHHGPLLPVS